MHRILVVEFNHLAQPLASNCSGNLVGGNEYNCSRECEQGLGRAIGQVLPIESRIASAMLPVDHLEVREFIKFGMHIGYKGRWTGNERWAGLPR